MDTGKESSLGISEPRVDSDYVKLETYLVDSHKKSISHQLPETLRAELQQSENPPANLQSRNRIIHREHWKHKHERQLTYHCARYVHCVQVDQLVRVELQVFLKT